MDYVIQDLLPLQQTTVRSRQHDVMDGPRRETETEQCSFAENAGSQNIQE